MVNDILHLLRGALADDQCRVVIIDNNEVLDTDGGDGAPGAVDEGIGCVDSDGVGHRPSLVGAPQ